MLKQILNVKMLTTLLQGVSAGLPLLLAGSTLQAWMRESDVSLATIGVFALAGLPYSLKFLWSPLIDRYALPFLTRRRAYIFLFQVLLLAMFFSIGVLDPKTQTGLFALFVVVITFFSASQDIVIDAYRREALTDEELGLGSSLYVTGYRGALWISGGFALWLADFISWGQVYWVMGSLMGLMAISTLFAPIEAKGEVAPKSLKEAVIEPLIEFFQRKEALIILLFVLLYKLGDSMAAHMSMPLYIDLGFDKTQIAGVVKTFGIAATIGGGLLGGVAMLKLGIGKSLWIFGLLQMVSTVGFSLLAMAGSNLLVLTGVIAFENLASGMGTTAYMAYMASITNRKFTATQYALLTSLMALPRTLFSAVTGVMVEGMGYVWFFAFCAFIALPGMLLLFKVSPWVSNTESNA
ncbi:MAG: AmpG family muropeptide MFS transporter [Halobacteriovoraceae bacterium]|nr:AmpG family muropeptide MFS transporter [Halobacteriovoraceae bacterium]|tara:strand:- start:173598 stop:174821 length:1224 start_codon:yes stop_codon:yes gene_type:complete